MESVLFTWNESWRLSQVSSLAWQIPLPSGYLTGLVWWFCSMSTWTSLSSQPLLLGHRPVSSHPKMPPTLFQPLGSCSPGWTEETFYLKNLTSLCGFHIDRRHGLSPLQKYWSGPTSPLLFPEDCQAPWISADSVKACPKAFGTQLPLRGWTS